MTINNDAVIVPGVGHFYIAATSATKPTGTAVPSSPWAEIGHTSFEDPLTIEREGGDSNVLSSWQASALRTRLDAVVYKLKFSLLQHDFTAFKLYYGGGTLNATTDEFEVPKIPSPQTHSLFVRVVDGSAVWARYFGTVEIIGSDDEEMDPENLLGLPVTATVLEDPDLSYLFSIAGSTTVS